MRKPAWSFDPCSSIVSRSARLLATTSTAIVAAVAVAGCIVYAPPRQQPVYVEQPPPAAPPQPAPPAPPPPAAYEDPAPQAVVSVYVDPPLAQPAPIAVGWAPPPMLVEAPPPMPFVGAVWVGGYWVWQGNWVWAAGRWAPPPQPGYVWVHPYYENRDGVVIFVTGHWHGPGVVFVPPPPTLRLTVVAAAPGVIPGPRPIGPIGVFVPAPPGSRFGLIVPAPIGTAPAVVTSAPPVVNVGMRIQPVAVNNTHVTNVTNVTNITNVTIVAPAGATAGGRAFESAVPAQAHLAAAMPAVVHVPAPVPASARPIPAYVAGRPPPALPPAQMVRPVARTAPSPGATMPAPVTAGAPGAGGAGREVPPAAGNPGGPVANPQQAAVAPGNAGNQGRDRIPATAQEGARGQPDAPHAGPVATAPATAGQPAPQKGSATPRDDRMKGDSARKGGETRTAKAEQQKNGNGAHEKKPEKQEEKHPKGEKERE